MGASKLAMSSTRVMGTCAIGGQAIGTAAAKLVLDNLEDMRYINIEKLQQQLLKDDCYLPNLSANDELDIVKNAKITASSQAVGYEANNLTNGVNRQINDQGNAWHSCSIKDNKPEELLLEFENKTEVKSLQLVFDSDFFTEKKITLSSTRQNQQKIGVPTDLVRDFKVEFLSDNKVLEKLEIKDNYHRLVKLEVTPTLCDGVKITFLKTWGCDCFKVFEVRIY